MRHLLSIADLTRDDVERILAATDVYVRPGVVEGFIGITVLEAQALGVPVVSFRTDDVQLAVEGHDVGAERRAPSRRRWRRCR